MLYAGWASPLSTWNGSVTYETPYAIAVLDISGYIKECIKNNTVGRSSYHSGKSGGYIPPHRTRAVQASLNFDKQVK